MAPHWKVSRTPFELQISLQPAGSGHAPGRWGRHPADKAAPSGHTKGGIGSQNCWRVWRAEAAGAVMKKTAAALAIRSLYRKWQPRKPVTLKKVEFFYHVLKCPPACWLKERNGYAQ
jgi:hypothetical protein